MIYGIRTSVLGAMAQEAKLSVISNNIANSQTVGFKSDRLAFKERMVEALEDIPEFKYYNSLVHKNGGAPFIESIQTSFEQGTLKYTGNNFDFALNGDGFFVVESVEGSKRYMTRNGNFKVDALGNFMTTDGKYRVLNSDLTPIKFDIDRPLDVSVSKNGEIFQGGLPASFLGVFVPRDLSLLEKAGDNMFVSKDGQLSQPPITEVVQGSVEESVANAFSDMTEMIQTVRNVETNLRMASMQDSTADVLINRVAR